jgi:hypothetical protein
MNKHTGKEKGSTLEGMVILGALAVIIVFFILPRKGVVGPARGFIETTDQNTYNAYAESQNAGKPVTTSSYRSLITLGQGNAAYSVEPNDEYITIQNQGGDPVNITGWKLSNNKGERVYYSGNQPVSYTSDEAIIPQATGYIASGNGYNLPQNVILAPNETAIITTGSVGVQTPYRIVSFKENKCSGYIEALRQYDFTPTLNYSCVPPSQEPGIEAMDVACKNFINGLSACQTPIFGKLDRSSIDNCDNCVNGRPAPSSVCLNFIKQHFNYEGCLDNHKSDAKFYSNTWRIFLGRKWEMWGKEDEVISLFDQFNKLVFYRTY